ncbi:Isopenicillin N epimerase [Novipirellula galeiformis]|uniref:Isopenicillin N epimerase n=1 Tax=Novipirellula galeiformis TaxID=2528004 RepID=A0A5C6CPV0_9BACT|nr:aminotransferase class V-fold PLP-dependent enzyme [Novipirellula galeiformis]TWU26570.1 Isopenicillin N epimerase [Novipirellula galeiformis]
MKQHWKIDPRLDFLNHGSFGAVPTVVLQAQQAFRDELESDPIRYLAPERELEPKLDYVRDVLSELIVADAADLAFVLNATAGVNAVLRSFPLRDGDEIVVTNHGYNACNNAAHYAAERAGAIVRTAEIPFPVGGPGQVVDAIEQQLSDRTRMVMVDHVTSSTGLVFPVQAITDLAHARNIRVLVDGAHAPGMVPLNLAELGVDYYTANHHKWLCAPKVSGFLWVHPQWQSEVRPTIISHAANRPRPNRSRFLAEFDWQGTFDPTPLVALPHAIEFLQSFYAGGIDEWMAINHNRALDSLALLSAGLGIDVSTPAEMIGSLVTVPLPLHAGSEAGNANDSLQQRLREHYRIECPVFAGIEPESQLLRISLQAYNDLEQVKRLVVALRQELDVT